MSRIVYWTEVFWPSIGGIEILGKRFTRTLKQRGHEVVVVTGHTDTTLPDEEEHLGIRIHRFPFVQAVLHRRVEEMARIAGRLKRLYRDLKADLYHVNFTGPGVMYHLSALRAHPAPMLVAIHVALPKHDHGRGLSLDLLRRADWVTANSENILAHTRTIVPDIAARSSVIYNGLEPPALKPEPLRFEEPRLLCMGRMVDDKGFDVAIDALPEVLKRFPAVRLTVAGEGSARERLQERARGLGVGHVVDFPGWVETERIPELLNSATLVLMPSRWEEAFGLVALESAQMARPVIASRVGGLPEVVIHGENGLLVEKEDSPALADAICHLLDRPEQATRMGLRGRARALEQFGWERYVDAHEELYERLIPGAEKEPDHDAGLRS